VLRLPNFESGRVVDGCQGSGLSVHVNYYNSLVEECQAPPRLSYVTLESIGIPNLKIELNSQNLFL